MKEARLDEMMITIGHELGHAYGRLLSDPALEEAKAYAFTEAWVKVIVEGTRIFTLFKGLNA